MIVDSESYERVMARFTLKAVMLNSGSDLNFVSTLVVAWPEIRDVSDLGQHMKLAQMIQKVQQSDLITLTSDQ